MKISHRTLLVYSVVLYCWIFAIIAVYWKPALFFNESGELRQFGIGLSRSTIIPIWLFAIFAGIFSYLFVLLVAKFVR